MTCMDDRKEPEDATVAILEFRGRWLNKSTRPERLIDPVTKEIFHLDPTEERETSLKILRLYPRGAPYEPVSKG